MTAIAGPSVDVGGLIDCLMRSFELENDLVYTPTNRVRHQCVPHWNHLMPRNTNVAV